MFYTTALERLNESGELRIVPRANAKHAYLWARPARAIALGPEIAEFIGGASPERVFDAIEGKAAKPKKAGPKE